MRNDNAIVIGQMFRRFLGFQLGPLDLEVRTGRTTALLGPKGSGKSVIINALMNFDPRAGGKCTILGLDSHSDEVEIRRHTGYVGERPYLYTFLQLPALINIVRGFYPTWDDKYCVDLRDRFQLPSDKKLQTFSEEMQIRTALLLSLSFHPQLVVLDDPTSELTTAIRRDVVEEMMQVVQDEERTVVLASQNVSDIESFADYIVMISDGQIQTQGDKSELVERHRTVSFTAKVYPKVPADLILSSVSDGDRHRIQTNDFETLRVALAEGEVSNLEVAPMSLEDVFVTIVRKDECDG